MRVNIVCIALGSSYIRMWANLHRELGVLLRPSATIQMHLLTDNIREAKIALEPQNEPSNIPVQFHVAPSLEWPWATLLRYQLLRSIWEDLDADVIIYVDVDMLPQGGWPPMLQPGCWLGGVALVQHPGYPSRRRALGALTGGLEARHLLRPLGRSLVRREPGLGAWERRPISTAFVPRTARRFYVHGAVWMGVRERLGDMVLELADRTTFDLNRGVVAIFHDESHLNWWASRHPFSLLEEKFSAVARWKYTNPEGALLVSIDKDPSLHNESQIPPPSDQWG